MARVLPTIGSRPLEVSGDRLPSLAEITAHIARRGEVLGRHYSRKPPITAVFPQPKAVPLGEELYVVQELRLSDLARLQSWLEDAAGDPRDGLPPAVLDADPGTRRERVQAAKDAAQSWPPKLSTSEGRELLGSTPGMVQFLWVCLHEHQPGLTRSEVEELLGRVSVVQWYRLNRVVYGVGALQELADELDQDEDEEPSRAVNWCEEVFKVVEGTHWSYEQVGALRLSQWRNLSSGGKSWQVRSRKSVGNADLVRTLTMGRVDPSGEVAGG